MCSARHLKLKISIHFPHPLRVCQCAGRPGPGAEFRPHSVPRASRWWWSASRCPCRQSQTDPWEARTEVNILHTIITPPHFQCLLSHYSNHRAEVIHVTITLDRDYWAVAVFKWQVVWPICDAFILLQHTVVSGDWLGEICHKRNLHCTQTSLLPWSVDPVWQIKVQLEK